MSMKNNNKIRRIMKRRRMFGSIGLSTTLLSFTPAMKQDKKATVACTVICGICSALSVYYFINSLERFDEYEEGDEEIFLKDHMSFIATTVIDCILLANSIDTIRNWNSQN